MFKLRVCLAVCALALSACAPLPAARQQAAVQRLYVINCGESRATDVSQWTTLPADAGKPYVYLIKHAKGWMLWDSGMADSIARMPEGLPNPRRTLVFFVSKPLAQSLAEIGVAPADIGHFAMSHTHSDHTGNANLFAGSTIFMQAAEYEAAFGPQPQRFGFNPATYERLREAKVVKLNGDHDVFGDGSVVIKSTPGHTAGHQSLFVRLPKSAPVLLSGDFVHFAANWDAKRAPLLSFDREQTLRSMAAMDAFTKQTGARLWINHDGEQSRTIPKAPAYVE
jgi:N-acyl homoserine lactone hydrolase